MPRVTHGMFGTRTYKAWANMLSRCRSSNSTWSHRYKSRGIDYDPRWERFENFLADMGPCPSGLTLERRDNDFGYCKGNCCWATRKEQSNNTCRNNRITHQGRTLTVAQWARETGLHPETIRSRWARTNDTVKVFAPKHKRLGLYKGDSK